MARRPGHALVAVLALSIVVLGAGSASAQSAATPTAPTHVVATRIYVNGYGTTARLTFHNAKPRGEKVTGYSALCRAGGPAYRYKVVGKHSPATVRGLEHGLGYGCTLQARSAAGYGPESKPFSILP